MLKSKLLIMLSSCMIFAATAQETKNTQSGADGENNAQETKSTQSGADGENSAQEAKNLIPAGDGEDVLALRKNWGGYIKCTDTDQHSGKGAILIDRAASVMTKTFIPIDSDKTYLISGWFKSKDPEQLSRIYFDVRYYTADKKAIKPRSVQPASNVSELARAAEKGATELLVTKNKWPRAPHGILAVAFNAKEDLSDLPNLEFARIKKYTYADEGYKITLSKPLTNAYPAGSKVRLHRYRNYQGISKNRLPADKWTQVSFTIGSGASKKYQFWPGAKYIKFSLANRYSGKPKSKDAQQPQLLVDDISVTEVLKEEAAKTPVK